MNRVLSIGGGGLLIAAAAFVILPGLNKGDVFIDGNKSVNSTQVREKLESDGWSNVEIKRHGRYIVAVASKNGLKDKFWDNSEDGRLRVFDDDEDGNDDDDDD